MAEDKVHCTAGFLSSSIRAIAETFGIFYGMLIPRFSQTLQILSPPQNEAIELYNPNFYAIGMLANEINNLSVRDCCFLWIPEVSSSDNNRNVMKAEGCCCELMDLSWCWEILHTEICNSVPAILKRAI
ncbi:hypothetical protein Nepgr_011808 [Nepenthes gracilis]|uniref:Uncharacterized protein n=1 Tax=Nepenthes gracilis TaxID=150966 RepID=A0AAD3SF07_NEPGR|nr:hypothetical protein Nepgr_011808 [Nepenthes gracilis]